MITERWKPLRYHPQQARLWRTTARFVAVAAGRGSGKTELARRRVVRYLPVKKEWADPLYAYCLPTFNQAKKVAWPTIKALVPAEWLSRPPNDSELIIRTKFGSELHVIGLDRPQRAEGVQWDGLVIDESCDQRPKVFDLNLRPAMSHRNAWCWRIGVPKRFGVGASEFKEFFDRGLQGKGGIESYTWPSTDIMTPEEIASAQSQLDERDFNEQYKASWETAGGAIFYAFDEHLNVDASVRYDPSRTIHVGSDFNVNPMCWVLGHVSDDKRRLEIFDELFIRDTNTQRTLDRLWARYGERHRGRWMFYGDATGQARKTAAAFTDYVQIVNDERFGDKRTKRTFYPRANPRVVNRFAACNAMLCNAQGERRLMISPTCVHLINDLKVRAWAQDVREPDDSGDVGHITDALGYLVYMRWPLVIEYEEVTPSVGIAG